MARALAWHARGHGFKSHRLHARVSLIEQTRVAKGTAARGRFPLVPVLKLIKMKTNIEKKIESMIIEELDRLNLGKRDADKVRQYRDANFLGGHYDHLFEKYIEDKELED